ncbi:MAG: hypothetical protein ACREMX_09950, partial [Gemmatimonadales bacterium]
MPRRLRSLLLVLLPSLTLSLPPGTVRPLEAQTGRSPRTALVLSGGGAKGIAHIGVLRTLD